MPQKARKISASSGFARKVPIELLLCATSVFSVPLWLRIVRKNNHRDTENTEVAQRNQTFRAKPFHLLLNGPVERRATRRRVANCRRWELRSAESASSR